MNEKEKQANRTVIDSYDYLGNAASTWDCTGLIPSLPASGAELEAYEALYHYQPPHMEPENAAGISKNSIKNK